MAIEKNKTEIREENLVDLVLFRFLPYWPLFVLLLFFSALGAAAYLVIATPLYSANAKILLKDEKKGADDAHILESLNIYGSKKIVENEMEVLASRTLMKEVATKLGLYAQVVESSGFRSQITYNTAPVIIEAREPDNLNSTKEPVPFAYDKDRGVIAIENVRYAVNQWVNTPYGVLKFNVNPKADTADKGPFFFSLASPRSIASVFASRVSVATSK
jgi:tyrosine-protein kinase Etk/Wzc